jgi:D-arabinose 1-dehydrogenase-like Zn-dependent alcohol dehydrogenase
VAATRDDLHHLKKLAEREKVTPLVERTYPLSRVPEAVADLVAGRVRGKAVISV